MRLKNLFKLLISSFPAPPDPQTFIYDNRLGYYYDNATGFYYDSHSNFYYDPESKRWLDWQDHLGTYVPVEGMPGSGRQDDQIETRSSSAKSELKDDELSGQEGGLKAGDVSEMHNSSIPGLGKRVSEVLSSGVGLKNAKLSILRLKKPIFDPMDLGLKPKTARFSISELFVFQLLEIAQQMHSTWKDQQKFIFSSIIPILSLGQQKILKSFNSRFETLAEAISDISPPFEDIVSPTPKRNQGHPSLMSMPLSAGKRAAPPDLFDHLTKKMREENAIPKFGFFQQPVRMPGPQRMSDSWVPNSRMSMVTPSTALFGGRPRSVGPSGYGSHEDRIGMAPMPIRAPMGESWMQLESWVRDGPVGMVWEAEKGFKMQFGPKLAISGSETQLSQF